MNARAIPRMSTPGSVQKRWSSTATIARRIHGEICWKPSMTSWFGGANMPDQLPVVVVQVRVRRRRCVLPGGSRSGGDRRRPPSSSRTRSRRPRARRARSGSGAAGACGPSAWSGVPGAGARTAACVGLRRQRSVRRGSGAPFPPRARFRRRRSASGRFWARSERAADPDRPVSGFRRRRSCESESCAGLSDGLGAQRDVAATGVPRRRESSIGPDGFRGPDGARPTA